MNMSGLKIGLAVAAVAALGLVASQGLYTVNDGERGVVVTLGKVVGVANPGTNWKFPFFTNVENFSIRDQVLRFDNLEAYTRDQQTATILATSVNFRILPEKVEEVYLRFGTQENLVNQVITRRVGQTLEEVFGQYNAESTTQKRVQVTQDVSDALRDIGEQPLQITSVQVEGISYSAEFEANIAAKVAAEVEVRRLEESARQAEVNARIRVIDAEAARDAAIAAATGVAEATRLQGEADAAAIRLKSEALSENPALIELTTAERWDGKLPTTMVPAGAVPFIDVAPVNVPVTAAQ